jgi:hypothetical protein
MKRVTMKEPYKIGSGLPKRSHMSKESWDNTIEPLNAPGSPLVWKESVQSFRPSIDTDPDMAQMLRKRAGPSAKGVGVRKMRSYYDNQVPRVGRLQPISAAQFHPRF